VAVDIETFVPYNEIYNNLVSILKKSIANLPEPSVFASKWPGYQDNPEARLLCLRPSTARGLPLPLLHDVFRHYLLNVGKPLPTASAPAKAALASAARLCEVMAHSFSDPNHNPSQGRSAPEKGRRRQFVDLTENILGVAILEELMNPQTDLHSGYVDAAFKWGDIPMMLAEFKAEAGTSGDAYMQIVRCYDLAVQVLKELAERDAKVCAFVKQGAPMFLLCVVGKSLPN
jgi:hypothetical protein